MRATMRGSICLLLLFTPVTVAYGQTFTGGIRGVVSDASGVVPGAPVTLINEATNVSRETVTNEVGQYNFPAVPPGTYTVKTQVSGFKTAERLRADPRTSHIPIAMVSASAQEADLRRGRELGVDAYVTKPFDPDELVRVVRELVETRAAQRASRP